MNKIKARLLSPLVAVAALSSCTYVPRLNTLAGRFSGEVQESMDAEKLEATRPQQAAQVYQRIIETTLIYKTLPDYQKQFGTELSQIAGGSTADFNSDSVMALPHVYDWAVEAVARSRVGLARLAWARGDLGEAEKESTRALELLGMRALSPLMEARLQIVGYELLRQVYAKQGKPGRERLAELNRDLLKDYLASSAASKDEEDARLQLEDDAAKTKTVDDFTSGVNSQRTTEALNNVAQVAGAMSQAMGTMQQYQINSAMTQTGGRVTPQIRQMQQTQRTMDFQRQMLSVDPAFKKGVDAAAAALSPFANLTISQQLVNPDYGLKAPQLIKTFTAKLADLSGNETIKQSAVLVQGSVDAVVTARGGKPADIAKALNKFADSFGSFQSQTQDVAESGANP